MIRALNQSRFETYAPVGSSYNLYSLDLINFSYIIHYLYLCVLSHYNEFGVITSVAFHLIKDLDV